jgi:hypothetical protein
MRLRTMVLLVASLLPLTSTLTRGDNNGTPSLVGTWRLISYKSVTADGTVTDLYGSTPLGQLIYDGAGHMSVHLLKADLPKCGTADRRKCPDREARIAFDNYLGYWGRYQIDASANKVTHYLEGASIPDWVGTSQVRSFTLEGTHLTLKTPSMKIGGIDAVQTLIWERQ